MLPAMIVKPCALVFASPKRARRFAMCITRALASSLTCAGSEPSPFVSLRSTVALADSIAGTGWNTLFLATIAFATSFSLGSIRALTLLGALQNVANVASAGGGTFAQPHESSDALIT